MRKSACIYFFYHLFFRQKGKRNRPLTFLRNGEDMSNFAKMVSCTTLVGRDRNCRTASSRRAGSRGRSTRRERNRLARFALEDDLEGDFSSVSFNKGVIVDADAEAEEERNNVLLNDPEGKETMPAQTKSKRIKEETKSEPATAAAVAKAKNARTQRTQSRFPKMKRTKKTRTTKKMMRRTKSTRLQSNHSKRLIWSSS